MNASTTTELPAESKIYFAMAFDPIHVGTGGYRLGRVDNTIVREPGTNLPKLPGTSLSGACRAYTAMATEKYLWKVTENGTEKEGSCAGQGQADEKKNKLGHCGKPNCPVCVSFGFSNESTGFQGLAQFSDVRILFFPVHSLAGPVWITCPAVLKDAGIGNDNNKIVDDNKIKIASGITVSNVRLNLGWIMLEKEGDFTISSPPADIPDEVVKRSVLVSNKLFSQIVNDNLEVRTSVSINPETGAAVDGALFTYEAIPRSTVFWFNITFLNPSFFKINGDKPKPKPEVKEAIETGLKHFEHLGIGGMNTRGMGRLRVLNLNGMSNNTVEVTNHE